MSTTGVSFKVEAQTPGSASLDGMARAAALLAQREAELTAQMRAAAAASMSVSDAERDAAQAIRTATIAVEMKADALGLSVAQLRAMEAATSQAAASEERAAAEAAQLAAALSAVSAAEERAATEAAQLAAHAASLSTDERQLAASIRETTAAAEMNAKALGLTGSQYSQLVAAKAKAKAEQDRLTASMAAGSKGMDAAGYAAGNLRFQMYDVGQSLAMGMNPMMILAQQGPQVAQAFTQASQSGATMGATIKAALGPLAVALPVVAVAAAGLAMAYQGLTAESESAAAAQAALALGLSHTEELTREATRSTARLQLIMEGASKEAIAAADTFYSTGDAYREATKESDALIASHVKLLELKGVPDSWEEAVGGVSRGMGDLADAIDRVDGGISGLAVNTGLFAFLSSAMDGVSTSTKELERELQAAVVGQLKMRDATDDVRRAKAAESNATHKQTEGSKAHRKAAKEEVETLQAQARALQAITLGWIASAAAEMDAERFAPPPVSEWEALANQIDQLVPQKTLSDMEKLAELSARVTEALAMGKLTPDQAKALLAQIDTTGTAITAANVPSTAGTAGKVGQALSSPLAAAVGADPTGIAAAVLAGLQSAANVQNGKSVFTEAADLITDALANLGPFVESAFAAVADIIAQAPVLLIRAIPSILSAVTTGIPKLIGALVGAVPDVIVALAGMIPEILPDLLAMFIQLLVGAVPQLIIGLIQAFTDPAFYVAIAEAFAAGIERAFAGKDGGAEENMILGSGTTAGGGFQLFGAQIVADEKSAANPRPTTIWIQAGDLWGDFTREIGIESGKLGRT